ncbi:hypothetical protein EDE15_2766 [Edaphobacter aggregans]|uniref:Uncharacterized protein n=1 Tax=Edaphobacter aggregans TaxID=570835 RepID=A0A428MK39_9BACT|nr:hypothetical protein EDE15_2766 [Edaphobacter aggregans]
MDGARRFEQNAGILRSALQLAQGQGKDEGRFKERGLTVGCVFDYGHGFRQ